MQIERFIQLHYGKLQILAKKITGNHQNSNDLLNDCLYDLLKRKPDIEVGKEINFISKMIKIQYNSKTSPFFFKYGNPNKTHSLQEEDDIEEQESVEVNIDKLVNDIHIYISNLDIYQKTVAQRHFINGVSQRELSKHYNINRIHISKTIKGIKNEVKQKFKRYE